MQNVRIRYKKINEARYISHLDLMRTMTRAIKRARIPLWYTEGFNPHAYMNFALPLSLGIEGMNEAFDIRIVEDIPFEEIKETLNDVLSPNIIITDVYEGQNNFNSIEYADYSIQILLKEEEKDNFIYASEALISGNDFIIEKLGKQGHKKVVKAVNLSDKIFNFNISDEGSSINIDIRLISNNSMNINPKIVIDALLEKTGTTPMDYLIKRNNLINKDGSVFI